MEEVNCHLTPLFSQFFISVNCMAVKLNNSRSKWKSQHCSFAHLYW